MVLIAGVVRDNIHKVEQSEYSHSTSAIHPNILVLRAIIIR